ncbi:protein CREG2 [Erpetoichthys calabaricus]|uniref:Cellular repressor of E1A-stimulated genes 2 n=1 Tax=Erpetoichthys calabaricus TaxID=27687 RepID=A0A8C4X5D6_ERPCA|nr:protein CREG2 [Erpetoichthys calabaricus]
MIILGCTSAILLYYTVFVCLFLNMSASSTLPLASLLVLLFSAASPGGPYVILNSVSWAVTDEVEEELDGVSNEDTLPALLQEDTSNIWKQTYPTSEEKSASPRTREPQPIPRTSRMFSYRREVGKATDSPTPPPPPPPLPPHEETAQNARSLVHRSIWGVLATTATQEPIKGVPLGNVFCISDGLPNNGTGIPFFYIPLKDSSVVDMISNPMATLTLSDPEGNYCREDAKDLEDLKCNKVTLMGKMVPVEGEEVEYAKEALLSRHPVMKKWPSDHYWFFMKLNVEHIRLHSWLRGMSLISPNEYFKTTPNTT